MPAGISVYCGIRLASANAERNPIKSLTLIIGLLELGVQGNPISPTALGYNPAKGGDCLTNKFITLCRITFQQSDRAVSGQPQPWGQSRAGSLSGCHSSRQGTPRLEALTLLLTVL